jgi:hypothetical protein
MEPHLAELRKSREVIDLSRTYRVEMPDGRIREMAGAELIATSEATVAVADAIRDDDPRAIEAAFERLGRTLEPGG